MLPTGVTARVRGIEVHGEAVPRAIAGSRTALNLGGIAVDELSRGDVVIHPGRVEGSHILDVELRSLRAAAGPLATRSKVLVHHGAAQVPATLVLLGEAALAPGATGLAQLRLDRTTPLAALPDHRFIVRGFVASPTSGSTIAGGRDLPRAGAPARATALITSIP